MTISQPVLEIRYDAEDFPASTNVPNGTDKLAVTWDEILWAAMTIGRPNLYYVFQHGRASILEAVFRLSLTRMALEQHGPSTRDLRRTEAAKTLDPTEKGAVHYFLGMTFCKLFAAQMLNTPWLLHLDVFRHQLHAVLSGRSRPDLVGQEHGTTQWHGFECKGRIRSPDTTVKDKAKDQARAVISVDGVNCSLHVGTITYFRNDVLSFYWCDPPAADAKKVEVKLPPDAWRHYYGPVAEIMRLASNDESIAEALGIRLLRESDNGVRVSIDDLDVEIGVHGRILKNLVSGEWDQARRAAAAIEMDGYYPDGIIVRAGSSWYERLQL